MLVYGVVEKITNQIIVHTDNDLVLTLDKTNFPYHTPEIGDRVLVDEHLNGQVLSWEIKCDDYCHGNMADSEFAWSIFATFGSLNKVKNFLEHAPKECVDLMQERLQREPTTDEDWMRMRVTHMRSREDEIAVILASKKGVELVRSLTPKELGVIAGMREKHQRMKTQHQEDPMYLRREEMQ